MKKILFGLLLIFAFMGCSNLNSKTTESLTGKEYVLTTSTKDVKITINFAEENFFGFSGVNNYFGKYTISGDKIKLSHVGSTLMAGPREAMEKEFEYISTLDKVEKYQVEKNTLIFTTTTGQQLIFKEAEKSQFKK
ncbi:META domain-containing protein [Fusobacterium sp.]|uniref:META domain-containing protein n=1 Tax=Fusobacterium sp. TaxID=68766 RepID=UPI00262C0B74|nr:META domain-containing protein [Fusobacterium sp.]